MTRIVALPGSLRRHSFNAALLRAAAELVPDGTELDIASIAAIPLYDGDLEAEHGIPGPVAELKERIRNADGLLLATPEYNNAMPGVLKNAIDWLSRPPADIPAVFGNRPVAVLGATPGRAGTILAQTAWLPVLRTLRMRPWFGGRLQVSRAGDVFDDDGRLVDDDVREQLRTFVRGFAEFAGASGPAPAAGG
ncbi:NADPH-dependent FMN reductase [Arhodomonas sp. AD133]|uniref:NADPH-dependent FMN reductase n=1 Tax=Arhodomonas sp. AD133 TaxID=3415009 RepID=UPI003EB80D50